jgi:hypothetical protein
MANRAASKDASQPTYRGQRLLLKRKSHPVFCLIKYNPFLVLCYDCLWEEPIRTKFGFKNAKEEQNSTVVYHIDKVHALHDDKVVDNFLVGQLDGVLFKFHLGGGGLG